MVSTSCCTVETSRSSNASKASYVQSGLQDGERIIGQNQLLVYDELND